MEAPGNSLRRRVGVKRYRMSHGRVRRQIFSSLEQDASELVAVAFNGSLMPRVHASSHPQLYFCLLRKIARRKSPLASCVSPGITIFHCHEVYRVRAARFQSRQITRQIHNSFYNWEDSARPSADDLFSGEVEPTSALIPRVSYSTKSE